MKVFISWSGEQSKACAHALREWLPLVLHYVQPWLSAADIGAGERWAQVMTKELETTNFGLLCITRENVSSSWVLFEAGSLAKSLEGARVIPLLLDMDFSDISGPLTQFQAKKLDRLGLMEVVTSINKIAQEPVPEPRALQLFEALWPQLDQQLTDLPKHSPAAKPMRTQQAVLEELVAAVRSIDSRLGQAETSQLTIDEESITIPVRNTIGRALTGFLSAWYAIRVGRKIEAIKFIREATGLDLKTAKDLVDLWDSERRAEPIDVDAMFSGKSQAPVEEAPIIKPKRKETPEQRLARIEAENRELEREILRRGGKI